MSSLSFTQAREILQGRIADSSDNKAVDRALNLAQRKVARAKRWPELIKRAFFNTEAAYSTGTVAITEAAATVTLTGGTFPTTVASSNHRFALGTSSPWYDITTRDSGTQVTLTDNFVQDTVTASAFITYKSQYELASDVDRVEEIWVHDEGRHIELTNAVTDQAVTEFLHYPSGPGVPYAYYHMERGPNGYKQILLGPETPDDVYRVEYTYRKQVSDNTFVGNLDESRWPVILALASSILYEPEFYERHIAALREYKALLADEWNDELENETQAVRSGQTRVIYPNSDIYLKNILGFGRVQDPS